MGLLEPHAVMETIAETCFSVDAPFTVNPHLYSYTDCSPLLRQSSRKTSRTRATKPGYCNNF